MYANGLNLSLNRDDITIAVNKNFPSSKKSTKMWPFYHLEQYAKLTNRLEEKNYTQGK